MSVTDPIIGDSPGRPELDGAPSDEIRELDLTGPTILPRDDRRRLGLRRRILLIFTLGALLLSLVLAFVTYGFTRSSVVQQRESTAISDAHRNASVVFNELRGNPINAQAAMSRLEDLGVQRPLVWYAGSWGGPSYTQAELPEILRERVIDDGIPARMIVQIGSETNIVVGYPLSSDSAYFEFFPMSEVENTLQSVRLSLILGVLITTALFIVMGQFAAARAVRPVGVAAQAAKAIAGGRLDTRLEATDDPDLSALANSFNDMATALQSRIERDARFASDVSHELRSPLMTLSASVDVMEARRDEMPERAQVALDLLKGDVVRFQGLVEDLLEISRFDAGAVRLHREELLAAEFVRHAVKVSSLPDTPIAFTERSELAIINGDRRRLARVLYNLIDNARLHGGGQPEVWVTEITDSSDRVRQIQINVEDHGAGVPFDERDMIFERFARGGMSGRRAGSDGAGLGLSLVDEHVRMHGGEVYVTDRVDGTSGARFVIELDAEELTE